MDWYMRMSTNPPPVNPKFEIMLKLCKEEDAILELISPAVDVSFHIKMDR